MSVQVSMFPETISVREDKRPDMRWPIDVQIDNKQYVYLTADLARELWHDLGAVLQSVDHELKAGAHEAGYVAAYNA